MNRLILCFLFLILISARFATFPVNATVVPTFPQCTAPQGELIVNYADGTHGIVGSTATYNGSDAVYKLSDIALTQCFCATDGTGIQTNWWKVSSITPEEVTQLINDGWKYVADGSAWGLDPAPYLSQNTTFSCTHNNGGGSNGGGGSSNGSSNSNNNGGSSGGAVLAAANNLQGVLGLAFTGDSWKLYFALASAFTFLVAGLFLSFKKSN